MGHAPQGRPEENWHYPETVAGDQPARSSFGAARKAESRSRSLSLDCLRGLGVLGMVLSGMLPFFHHTLPTWMYHAQMPPPTHLFRPEIVGITWVDVVFPLFLFSLGAAIPLALWPKYEAGSSRTRLAFKAASRGLALLFFAVFKQHLVAGGLVEVYGPLGNALSILGFGLLFLIFTRWPARWPGWVKFSLMLSGLAGAVALMLSLTYPGETGFTVHRHDIIITILANVVITTTLVWLVWPDRVMGRILIMVMVTALLVARRYTHWGVPVTELLALKELVGDRIYNGIIWACNPLYQQYLLITIPGTIAGETLLNWFRPASRRLSFHIQNSRWRELSLLRCVCVAIVSLALVVVTVAGLTLNEWVTTGLTVAPIAGLGLLLLYSPPARRQLRTTAALRGQSHVPALLFRQMFVWGIIWLALGLALFPYEGGIRKDPPTLSYFFVTAGVACLVLICFSIVTEAMHRPGPLFLLIDCGQNPMIAYVAAAMFVVPVLQLIPVGDGSLLDFITMHTLQPWPAFGRAVALTLVVAGMVSVLTRLRIFWRT